MKFGLSSLLFVRSSIEDAVRASAEVGSECIEIIYDAPHFMPGYDRRQLKGLKELIDSYGLDVAVHGSFWDLNPVSHHREVWELSLKWVKQSIKACERLGGKISVLHPGRVVIPELEWFMREAKGRYLKFIEECRAFASERGIKIAVENMSLPYWGLYELCELVWGREDLGIALDIAHAYLVMRKAKIDNPERELARAIGDMGKKIFHVHLHDNRGEHDEHLVPGEGSINFEPIVSALKAIDYSGMIIVELFDPGNAVEAGRMGLDRARKLLR